MLRPATKDDAKDFPVLKNATFKAMVAEEDGVVMGIAGYLYEFSLLQAFSNQKKGIKPLTVAKLGIATIKMFKEAHAPIFCKASTQFENSKKFLGWLGFRELENDMFIWEEDNERSK